MVNRRAMQVGATLCAELGKILQPGMHTLECGSGLSTWLFFAAGCDHTSLEHDARYAPPLPCVEICPLVGKPPWYDWTPAGPYDVVLIDGPPGNRRGRRRKRRGFVGRVGLLRVIDKLVDDSTTLIFDDTNRAVDLELATTIAERFGYEQIDVPAEHPLDFKKQFTILRPY